MRAAVAEQVHEPKTCDAERKITSREGPSRTPPVPPARVAGSIVDSEKAASLLRQPRSGSVMHSSASLAQRSRAGHSSSSSSSSENSDAPRRLGAHEGEEKISELRQRMNKIASKAAQEQSRERSPPPQKSKSQRAGSVRFENQVPKPEGTADGSCEDDMDDDINELLAPSYSYLDQSSKLHEHEGEVVEM